MHAGFLQALEESGIEVQGVMGTSAGALAGSLYCAGYKPQQVAAELSRQSPISLLDVASSPWGGMLSMRRVVARLRELLPPTFEELQREFALGVVDSRGQYRVVSSGPLPEAVVASAAVPLVFQPVVIPQVATSPCLDGGMHDRVGLTAWRERRRKQLSMPGVARPPGNAVPPALVHLVARSSPFSGADDVAAMGEDDVTVVTSPRSSEHLWELRNFERQFDACRARTLEVMGTLEGAAGEQRRPVAR